MQLASEIYSRQNKIDLSIPETASVVGCGGTGFWTAVFLAMSGVQNIILVDDDVLEASNRNRLPIRRHEVGMRKVESLYNYLTNLRSDIRVERHFQKIVTDEDLTLLRGSIFCCTDNLKSQQKICAYAKANNQPYQRIGYDGTVLNVSKGFPLSFEEEAEDAGGYSVTPSWVVPAAVAAGLGVFSRMKSELCLMDDLGKVGIEGSTHVCGQIKEALREEGKEDGRQQVFDSPGDYSLGDCNGCDRGDCDNCDYYSPESHQDAVDEAREEGRVGGRDQVTDCPEDYGLVCEGYTDDVTQEKIDDFFGTVFTCDIGLNGFNSDMKDHVFDLVEWVGNEATDDAEEFVSKMEQAVKKWKERKAALIEEATVRI